MKYIIGFEVGVILTIIFLTRLGTVRYKNERILFEKAIMFTAEYRNKYGEYPSYWLWNKVYEYPEANVDSLKKVGDSLSIEIQKQFKSKQ